VSTIARLKAAWTEEHMRWQKHDLSAKRYVYSWADGIHLEARLEEQAKCILVIIGATPEGKKELVGFTDGIRESSQSWHVGGLVRPAALLAGCRPHLAGRLREPERAIGNCNLRRSCSGRVVLMTNVILIGESPFRLPALGSALRMRGGSRRASRAENTSHLVHLNRPKRDYFANRHRECDAA
jgi:hypothetical protein